MIRFPIPTEELTMLCTIEGHYFDHAKIQTKGCKQTLRSCSRFYFNCARRINERGRCQYFVVHFSRMRNRSKHWRSVLLKEESLLPSRLPQEIQNPGFLEKIFKSAIQSFNRRMVFNPRLKGSEQNPGEWLLFSNPAAF